jgi:hypothetical protein
MLLREADPERAVTHRPLAPAISNVAQKRADQWDNLFTEVESTRRRAEKGEPARPTAPARVPTSAIAINPRHAATSRPPLPVYSTTFEGAELNDTTYEEARLRGASPPPPPPPQPLLEPVRVGRTTAAPLPSLPPLPPRGLATVSVSTARHQRYDQPEDEYGAPAASSQPPHATTHRRHRYELQDYEEGEAQQDELVDSYEEVDASQESLLSGEYRMRSSGGSHSSSADSSADSSAGSGEGSTEHEGQYKEGDYEAGAEGNNSLHNDSADYSSGDEEQFGDYPVDADSYQLYEHDGYGHSGDQGREWAKTVAQQGVDLNDSFALIQLCYNSGL